MRVLFDPRDAIFLTQGVKKLIILGFLGEIFQTQTKDG